MRQVFVMRNGKAVPKHLAEPLQTSGGPNVISDFAEPVKSMIDGKYYGSRRYYHDHVRAHGCRVVGNDLPPPGMTRNR